MPNQDIVNKNIVNKDIVNKDIVNKDIFGELPNSAVNNLNLDLKTEIENSVPTNQENKVNIQVNK